MPETTNQTNKQQQAVDLSVCRPGDLCHYPNGTSGVITAWHYGDGHPWWASRGADGQEYAHNREGRRDRTYLLEFDIIRVERDGIQITPVIPGGSQVTPEPEVVKPVLTITPVQDVYFAGIAITLCEVVINFDKAPPGVYFAARDVIFGRLAEAGHLSLSRWSNAFAVSKIDLPRVQELVAQANAAAGERGQ